MTFTETKTPYKVDWCNAFGWSVSGAGVFIKADKQSQALEIKAGLDSAYLLGIADAVLAERKPAGLPNATYNDQTSTGCSCRP